MTSSTLRTMILAAAAVSCTGAAFAQMGTSPAATGDTSAQDKLFLMKSAEGSMAEIALSKMALKKSKNDEVKTYAQKMIDDHTTLLASMKPFADQMGVQPPAQLNKVHQIDEKRLSAMSGDAFDKEYVKDMVADHHKDLGEFMAEAGTTSNADLKAAVTQGAQVVKDHTMMIDAIAQKDGIATPPMPPASSM